MQRRRIQHITVLATILAGILSLTAALAAGEHLRGVIAGRADDGSLTLRTDASDVAVMLSETTKVRQISGVRSRKVDVPSLIPGLRVDVEGRMDAARFVADRITFTTADLKTARDIQAGITPTDVAVQANRGLIDANQQQNARRFDQQQEAIAAADGKIVATTGALEATNARIANLDDYTVVDTVTVYFRNGRSDISHDYQAQLTQLALKAKNVDGYTVQILGYASAVGRDATNQRLSKERADKVAAVLAQSGIPSTRLFVPTALGTSDQVASNTTKTGQAENRRTVVRLLQSRGITGN
ncbi:MAG TPA: OmpA family protein [Vicinamibacterales bacterium]|nr:OmpA family protein [Vicinamibacterales bacterium]